MTKINSCFEPLMFFFFSEEEIASLQSIAHVEETQTN